MSQKLVGERSVMNVRAKFDDFLRDVGLAANYERDHPVIEAEEVTE